MSEPADEPADAGAAGGADAGADADTGGGDGKRGRRQEAGARKPRTSGPHRHYHVTVSADEDAELVVRAAGARVSVPRLLVDSALSDVGESGGGGFAADGERVAALYGDVARVLRKLSGVATNLNQIARVANAGGGVQPGIGPAIDRVQTLSDRIETVLAELDGGRRYDVDGARR